MDAADYMISICGNEALRELSSPGKSGSFFYLTNDDRYMIKTMKKAEAKVSVVYHLPSYFNFSGKSNQAIFYNLYLAMYSDAGPFKNASSLLQSFSSI